MIVLPNSFEKYLYNLRIYTSLSILKHGILPRHLKNLKKIYLAEAFLFKNHTEPTDLRLLSYNLLDCVKNLKEFKKKITDKTIYEISALNNEGLEDVIEALGELVINTKNINIERSDAYENWSL